MVPLSQNLYAYAMNNPLSFIDPSGHYNIPLSIEMAGAYAVEMYLIKTGQKVPADKKIIQAEITNLEQVYNRASLSEKDAIKATLDAKKEELDGNGGLYSIVGIEKISREFNAVYDPNMQIQGTANGTAQPQMITVGEKEKWGWASKAVAEDTVNWWNGNSYTAKSSRQIIQGNFTDDVTLLGTAGQIATGVVGIDLPGNIRDITSDVANWKWSWGHVGQTAGDAVAFLPVIGALKYSDEIGTLAKNVVKSSDEVVDGAKGLGKAISSSNDVIFNSKSIDKAFTKHRGDFGSYPDGSKSSVKMFEQDIRNLIDTGVQKSGTWKGVQGTHIYNPVLRQWAFVNSDRTLNTAFKLSVEQYKYLLETGVVK